MAGTTAGAETNDAVQQNDGDGADAASDGGAAGTDADRGGPHDAAADDEWGPESWGVRPGTWTRAAVAWHRTRTEAQSVAYGYHNAIKATEAAIQPEEGADAALHCCPASQFIPDPGRLNILITMHESRDLAREDAEALEAADWLVTPSEWCARTYRRRPGFHNRVTVAPLPIRLGLWTEPPAPRPRPGHPFRWLWIGSADPRKGQATALLAWRKFFMADTGLELYLKSTARGVEEERQIEQGANITLDWRNLPTRDLVALVKSADGFLFPTSGEGYGYPLVEAMAAGVPAVATAATATGDYMNHRTGWPVPTRRLRMDVYRKPSEAEDGKYEMELASVVGAARAMIACMANYGEALRRARQAQKLASGRARLDNYGRRLHEAVRAAMKAGPRERSAGR